MDGESGSTALFSVQDSTRWYNETLTRHLKGNQSQVQLVAKIANPVGA